MEVKTFSSALILSFLLAPPAAMAMNEEQGEESRTPTSVQAALTRDGTDSVAEVDKSTNTSNMFEPLTDSDDEDAIEQEDVASQKSQIVPTGKSMLEELYAGVWNLWGLLEFVMSQPEKTANTSTTVSKEDLMKASMDFVEDDPDAFKIMVEGLRNPADEEKFKQAKETANQLYEKAKKKKEEEKAQTQQPSSPIAQKKKKEISFIWKLLGY